jgi:putative DNA primase/helicase
MQNDNAAVKTNEGAGGQLSGLPYQRENAGTGESPPAPSVIAPAVLSWDELGGLEIPRRKHLLGDWFCAGDYGVIFGRRGLGKSWLALALACSLAQGRALGPWQCPRARRVLYVDGEMALDDLRDRVLTLAGGGENFFTLSHQTVFDRSKAGLCASDKAQQAEITRYCEDNKIDVLFLDNGACLFRNVKENDADDFRDLIEGWLLDLRRRGIAVVLVLHAGRSGAIRGTSKREDAAFWILRLDEVSGGDAGGVGARFMTRFSKNRNAAGDPPPHEWHFEPDKGKVRITHKEADSMGIFLQWIRDGLETCGEIADEMGLSKGQVSKLAKRAEKAGSLKIEMRRYVLP